jgi:hypothetical protein
MGSSAGIPDVSVRLSAQGVQDVVNAFARVRQEAKTTGVETAGSLELINGALETLTELLPAISFAIAVEKLAEVALGAREAAEDIGKLSEKTGASIGTLSALALSAHDNEVEFDSLSKGLIKLARSQEEATNGSKVQLKAFKDIGISVQDLKTQDPGQLFVTVAEKLEAIPAGAQKAQLAIALFGKAGAELIPMLDDLGTNGFDKALEKAKSLGLYLDGDMVASARAAQDAVHELEDIAQGLGTRFIAGFVPQFTQGIETLAQGLEGEGVDSVRWFGEEAGKAFNGVISLLLVIGALFKTIFRNGVAEVKYDLGQMTAAVQGFGSGGIGGAIAGATAYSAENGAALDAYTQKNADEFSAYYKKLNEQYKAGPERTPSKPRGRGVGGSGDGSDAAQQAKTAQARSAYLQSLADNELAILKLKNQVEEAEDKRAYDAGLLTLDEYYDRREQRIREESDAELAVLQKKQAAASALPDTDSEQHYKKLQAEAAVQTQISELELREQAQLKAAEDDRAKAKRDATLREMTDIQRLQQMSGDRYGAEETALQIELQQYTDLLAKQGKSVDEIQAAVDAYARKGQARIDFQRSQEEGSSAVSNLNIGIGAIQSAASNGSISNIQAQAQINQLQRESLDTLSAIGLQMFKNAVASEDPKAIAMANEYRAGIDQLAKSLQNVTTAQTYLVNQLSSVGVGALTDFFTAGISGSKSFKDALGDLANSFEQIVAGMISKLLVYYTVLELVGWVSGTDSTVYQNLSKQSPFGNSLTGHADGGWTGDVPPDQVAGIVHGQEFVVRAGPASQYRAFLQAINDGKTPAIKSIGSAATSASSSYADELASGGGVSFSASTEPPVVQVINNTGQPTTQRQTTGPGGQSITQIIVGAVATDIAKGGQVAQAIQANYGAQRQGVRRGS